MLSGSTGPEAVVWVVVVELFGATLAEGAAFVVEACTRRRELSLLVEGPVGSVGPFWTGSAGFEFGAGVGELVCALTREREANTASPAQIKVLKRLAINMM
jgi:hypothetical protein